VGGSVHAELIENLKAFGLNKVTADEVENALLILYPKGTSGQEPTDLLQPVYRHLRRQGLG
jgi:hypothetical protein